MTTPSASSRMYNALLLAAAPHTRSIAFLLQAADEAWPREQGDPGTLRPAVQAAKQIAKELLVMADKMEGEVCQGACSIRTAAPRQE